MLLDYECRSNETSLRGDDSHYMTIYDYENIYPNVRESLWPLCTVNVTVVFHPRRATRRFVTSER